MARVTLCKIASGADDIVFGSVISIGGTRQVTFSGFAPEEFTELDVDIAESFRGSRLGRRSLLVRGEVTALGHGIDGDFEKATGFFFLRNLQSQSLVVSSGFYRFDTTKQMSYPVDLPVSAVRAAIQTPKNLGDCTAAEDDLFRANAIASGPIP